MASRKRRKKPTRAAALKERRQRFVEAYMEDPNATQAAIKAGYSEKTARSIGQRLLTNVDVSRAIAAAREARSIRKRITADYVLENLDEVLDKSMREKELINPVTGEGTGKFVFDSKGANKALELMGKHLGMFTEKVEHSGSLTVQHDAVQRMRQKIMADRQAVEIAHGLVHRVDALDSGGTGAPAE